MHEDITKQLRVMSKGLESSLARPSCHICLTRLVAQNPPETDPNPNATTATGKQGSGNRHPNSYGEKYDLQMCTVICV